MSATATTPTAPPRATSRLVRLARCCNAHRWRTFLAWLLALVVLQVGASAIGAEQVQSVRLPGTESQEAYDLLAKHFPAQKGDADQVVYRARAGRLGDPAVRSRIESSLERVRADRDIASVSSPFSPGGQVSGDGRIGLATITYRTGVDNVPVGRLDEVQKRALGARSRALQVEHGGPGAEAARQGASSGASEMLSIGLAAIVLFITFGSLVAMGLPLLATIMSLGCSLAVITGLSHLVETPEFATQLATLIGLGVGVDYALFIVTRYRSEVRGGMDRDEAVERAVDTAGRTVMFAASTVVVALLGLLLLGLSFLQGVALGAAAAVLATMFASVTLVPALIGGAGRRMDALTRRRADRVAARAAGRVDGASWSRWSRGVQRHPYAAGGVALAVLVALAAPVLGMRLGSSDAGVDPAGSSPHRAYDLVSRGFGAGANGPFVLVAELPRRGDSATAHRIAAAVRADGDMHSVSAPVLSPDGAVATISASPRTGPQDSRTGDALDHIRDLVIPAAEAATGARVRVGGLTATNADFTRAIAGKLPVFVGVVVALSALLLLVVFRSVLIPIKAAALNLLSIGAALGFVTLVFQDGVGADVLGIGTGPIESFVPVLVFAIVFGLSMDYEVFLLSRMHEEWTRSGDASGAVHRGLQATGRVITAAGAIMVLVFASFALADDRVTKLFALGLASAVFLDAVVIRCLLVPAVMEILGRRAWWLPATLERRLPRLDVEGGAQHGRQI